METRLTLSLCWSLLALLALSPAVRAQGVTTATITGTVTDQSGAPLPGANVVALHEPSGTEYGTAARADGRYTLPDVRVGGPYSVHATYIGYAQQVRQLPSLTLGQTLTLDFALVDGTVELGGVQVTAARSDVLNSERTGAATSFSRVQVERLPVLNRSLSDFTRLNPQSTGSNSFSGRNNLYNNVSVDGSVFNNVFGLASEVGGQTNANPISLDAVEQIQISIAPYDVRQGSFTGAGINVITRSGTNEFTGTVYSYLRNDEFTSDEVAGSTVSNPNFSQRQTGFSVGGPIVRNRAFFFVNAELGRRTDPGATFRPARTPGETGADVSSVLESDLVRLRDVLQQRFGYNPGSFDIYDLATENDKVTARFDLNLNRTNRFSLRYNYLDSFRDVPPSNTGARGGRQNSQTRVPFSNTNYLINNNMHSVVAQLNTTIGNRFSNALIAGFTALRDFRDSKSSPFPLVDVENGAGSTFTSFGYEPFTANNLLDTDIWQFSNNFTAYLGAHTVTVGTSNEFYSFSNGFTPQFYGRFQFRSLDDFIAHVNAPDPLAAGVPQPTQYQLTYSAVPGVAVPLAEVSAAQLGFYAQDEYQVTPGLKVTAGLRVDVPIFPSELLPNPTVAGLTFAGGERIDVSKLPDATPLWSPRVGFNWDALSDGRLQVRGGTGVFTGKIPFVWISNQASNTGVLFGTTDVTGNGTNPLCQPGTGGTNQPACSPITFTDDVAAYIPANPSLPSSVLINATVDDFKFPQVWRTNVGVDVQLPYGVIGTLEGIYTKDINAVLHRNANLRDAVGTFSGADQRPRYAGSGASSSAAARINAGVTNAIVLDNTDEGYQYQLTAQLQKEFAGGLFGSLAYTHSRARDITSNQNATAVNAVTLNPIVADPNDPSLGYSLYDVPHRIVGVGSYRLEAFGLSGTTLSLVYVGSSGFNYSYIYAGDMNGDGFANDLMYIPGDRSEIVISPATGDTRTPDAIWEQIDAFIEQDPYLSEHRGEYAERGAARSPWYNRFDLGVKQEFFVNVAGRRNTIELGLDLINVGNLLSSKWGVRESARTTQPIAYRTYDAAQNTPTFTFPLVGGQPLTETFSPDPALDSRWQAQFSLRYRFN